MSIILEVKDLTMRFGGLLAVDSLSFNVAAGSITSVIGPNGAGKTTVFNCMTGFYRPTNGEIYLGDKRNITGWPCHRIARKAKIARTFQNIRLFGHMTVLENLLVAQHRPLMRASRFSLTGILGLKSYRDVEARAVEKSMYWLQQVGLEDFANEQAKNLPYGLQRKLEIIRALCTNPQILCLDEPAAGLNPRETEELNAFLLKIRKDLQLTILLIEHDMNVVMKISDFIVVLDHGKKIAEGTAKMVQNNPAVIKAYLGVAEGEEVA
jgi:branched-chain amino acid transport system ATP-binding protein